MCWCVVHDARCRCNTDGPISRGGFSARAYFSIGHSCDYAIRHKRLGVHMDGHWVYIISDVREGDLRMGFFLSRLIRRSLLDLHGEVLALRM